jgi:hypothetical protein
MTEGTEKVWVPGDRRGAKSRLGRGFVFFKNAVTGRGENQTQAGMTVLLLCRALQGVGGLVIEFV